MKQSVLKICMLLAIIMVSAVNLCTANAQKIDDKDNPFLDKSNYEYSYPTPGVIHCKVLVSYIDDAGRYYFHPLVKGAKFSGLSTVTRYNINSTGGQQGYYMVSYLSMMHLYNSNGSVAIDPKSGSNKYIIEKDKYINNCQDHDTENSTNHWGHVDVNGMMMTELPVESTLFGSTYRNVKSIITTSDDGRKSFIEYDIIVGEDALGLLVNKVDVYVQAIARTKEKVVFGKENDCELVFGGAGDSDGKLVTLPLNRVMPDSNTETQTPELLSSSIAAKDNEGNAKPGQMMVAFSSQHHVDNVRCIATSDKWVAPSTQNIFYVDGADSVRDISVTFQQRYRKECPHEVYYITPKEKINIPAYHKIHDFSATYYTDPIMKSQRGAVQLTWKILNPKADDAIQGDLFEIQRATKPDWSDAETLEAIQMDNSTTDYSYIDSTYTTLHWQSLGDDHNVYYRVRRASATMWDWEDLKIVNGNSTGVTSGIAVFSKATGRHTYQRPFSDVKATKAADWETTRNVRITATMRPIPSTTECTWHDRTAPIILTRTGYENPNDAHTVDHITIPEDSITYNPQDSCFYLSYTDKASTPCTHYSYTLRKDLANATLGLNNGVTIISPDYLFDQYLLDNDPNSAWIQEIRQSITTGVNFSTTRPCKIKSYKLITSPYTTTSGNSNNYNPSRWTVRAFYDDGIEERLDTCENSSNELLPVLPSTESKSFPVTQSKPTSNYNIAFEGPVGASTYSRRTLSLSDVVFEFETDTLTTIDNDVEADSDFYFDGGMKISNATATADNPKMVVVTWETTGGTFDHYEVYRKNTATNEWDLIADVTDMVYEDNDAPIGKDCTYKVRGILDCKKRVEFESEEFTGRRYEYGSVSGYVTYLDGTGCPGLKVNITKDGDKEPTVSTTTADDGTFLLDHVLFTSEGITYTVDVEGLGYRNLSLTGSQPVVTAFEFKNDKSVRFSGHVYFTGSTVPVHHANFEVNGHLVRSASGKPVETNASGDFSFQLPKEQSMTVRVVMDGHTFMDNGDVAMNGQKQFSLTGSLDNYVFYDDTKVRLIGRMVGGAIEGQKPLGLDLSENNLGDNAQLILELEGDNISHLVFEPTDLTIKERNDTIRHNGHQTTMLTQAKRITIRPDSLSGEYQVDLFPVKYKIVQTSAQGYSTLLPAGSAIPSLDLSDCIEALTDTVKQDLHLGLLRDTCVSYNAKYSVVYRSPISLTYKQLVYSIEKDYLGEKTFSGKSIADDDGNYTFKYPVFKSGNSYMLRVSAHEDYYYNNDVNNLSRHTQVPISNHDMRIYNGMNQSLAPQYAHLDDNGQAVITLKVDNPTFTLEGEDALRQVDMSVKVDGLYVQCEPLNGYVLGQRLKGKDYIQKFNSVPLPIDVIRDPQGSDSYAWIEQGSTLNLNFSSNWNIRAGVELDLSIGSGNIIGIESITAPGGVGAGAIQSILQESYTSTGLDLASKWHGSSFSTYSFKTNERISTSSDHAYVGAQGDVYIGTEAVALLAQTDAATIIDGEQYRLFKNAIAEGKIRILARYENETDSLYLVNMTQMAYGNDINGSFAYSQKYIINELVPRLLTERNALLLTKQEGVDYQAMANENQKNIYVSNVSSDHDDFGFDYDVYTPSDVDDFTAFQDEIDGYNQQMKAWLQMIADNEKAKLDVQLKGELLGTYDISANVTRQYSETTTASSSDTWAWDGIGNTVGDLAAGALDIITKLFYNARDTNDKKEHTGFNFRAFGMLMNLKFAPILELSQTRNEVDEDGNQKTAGFVLSTGSEGYESIDVYRVTNNMFSGHEDFNVKIDDDRDDAEHAGDVGDKQKYADFVFIRRGGATRNPYEPAEVTIAYKPGTEICPATLKIDNPKISFDKHEASNVPADEKACFTIRLSNESEISDGRTLKATAFNLYQSDADNQRGLKIYMDGAAITDGRLFYLAPGQSIEKTIEVVRGIDYDYDDIKLILKSSNDGPVKDEASFSVHYMPVSCPVTMQMPVQNWVMNTLSAYDKDGYYIPVEINGFDVNYENFDHIELQYKLKNEADDRWVNLCSYYASDSLYNLASGNKAMIENGRITNARFYGERDPMEQYYDLRAVSFCRLGSGFVNRPSEVKSGLKDTRRPELFGAVNPKNGILQVGDYISIPFSEDIAANYLDALYNFQITGYTNQTGLLSSTSLFFSGGSSESATTSVARNLGDANFTIDLMVKPTTTSRQMTYFTQGTPDKYVSFGQTADSRLFLAMKAAQGIDTIYSRPVDMGNDWIRVAAGYDRKDTESNVDFWLNTQHIDLEPRKDGQANCLPSGYNGVGNLMLGTGINGQDHYEGNMLEVRLWTTRLDRNSMVETDRKTLNGHEPNLLAYYPMNDATSITSAKDKANGATITLAGQTWAKPEGLSVMVGPDKPALALDGHKFSTTKTGDYTFTFWYKQTELATDTVALLASGRGVANEPGAENKIFIGLTKEGNILLQHNGRTTVGEGMYNDLMWHQMAMTVNRSMNIGQLYVDDKPVAQFKARELGALDCDSLFVGECHWKTLNADSSTTTQSKHYDFVGLVDEITLWNMALPSAYLASFYSQSPNDEEMGLLNHLSFSKRQIDAHNVYQTVYNPLNEKVNRDENGNKIPPKESDRLVLTADAAVTVSDDVAPIREKENLTNMNFSWVGKDNELLINLKMPDAEINKQNIFVTVRDVEDKAGNPMESPLSWTIFVDRNQLRWGSDYVDLTIDQNQGKEFTVDARNNASTIMNYTITDMPSWLSVDAPDGALSPTETTPLYFAVSDQLDPGEHSATIYLKDHNGLSEPLKINVRVNAVKPNWTIDPMKYNKSMNLIGRVEISEYADTDGNSYRYIDNNPEDIVAAFIHDECVGLGHISKSNDENLLYLTIYGSSSQYDAAGNKIGESTEGQNVLFQLWRQETGKVYYLHLDNSPLGSIHFKSDTVYGKPNQPIVMVTSDNAVQDVELQRGWNWVSFGVRPYIPGANFSSAFVKDYEFSEHDFIKSQDFAAEYVDGNWVSNGGLMLYTKSYMFKVAEPGTLGVTGTVLKTDEERTLQLKHGWNYLPYLCNKTLTVKEAMADYYDHAMPGDIIKTYNSFAMFSDDRQWVGSLTQMQPGVGYMLLRNAQDNTAFTYYDYANRGLRSKAFGAGQEADDQLECVLTRSHNMPVLATALRSNGAEVQQGEILSAYVGDELVGHAMADAQGRFFLMTSAEEGASMSFTLTTSDGEESSAPMLRYNSQSSAGTLSKPFCVSFADNDVTVYPTVVQDHINYVVMADDDADITLQLFDGVGNRLFDHTMRAQGGCARYTLNGLSAYAQGVYVAVVKVNGKTTNVKLIK